VDQVTNWAVVRLFERHKEADDEEGVMVLEVNASQAESLSAFPITPRVYTANRQIVTANLDIDRITARQKFDEMVASLFALNGAAIERSESPVFSPGVSTLSYGGKQTARRNAGPQSSEHKPKLMTTELEQSSFR
jgi:hypothetical protein